MKRHEQYEFEKLKKLDEVFELALKGELQTFIKNNVVYRIFGVQSYNNGKFVFYLASIDGWSTYRLTVAEVYEFL